MSFKSLTAIAIAIFFSAFCYAATAEAGCGGGHRGAFKSYNSSASYKAKKRARARARARLIAKKKAKAKAARIARAKKIAKAKRLAAKKAEAQKIADAKTESSFVSAPSTAALLTDGDVQTEKKEEPGTQKIATSEPAETVDTVIAAAGDTGCKRFIPEIGRAVTVDCN